MPKALRKFNSQKIQLYDTSKLKPEVDKEKWIQELKTLKWYGPFKFWDDAYFFQTNTPSGKLRGLHLQIYTDSHRNMFLSLIGKGGKECGT